MSKQINNLQGYSKKLGTQPSYNCLFHIWILGI